MSWGLVAGAAVSAVAGYAKNRADKKAAAKAKSDSQEMTYEESQLAKDRSAFDKSLEYYYTQKERKNKEGGLAEFRKFNQVRQIDPNYTQTSSGVVVPEQPTVDMGEYDKQQSGSSSGGKKISSSIKKLDPVGGGVLKALGF